VKLTRRCVLAISREESIPDDFTAFNERTMKPFTAEDVRFTTRGGKVYALCLGWPEKDVMVRSMAGERVTNVQLLGSDEKPSWRLEADGLRIARPPAF
jgi:alpha-L-fucosidase